MNDLMIAGRECHIYENGNTEYVLLRPVDDNDISLLGSDTDTVGAIAGGLAGLFYGYDSTPEEWIDAIQRKDFIDDICDKVDRMIRKYRTGMISDILENNKKHVDFGYALMEKICDIPMNHYYDYISKMGQGRAADVTEENEGFA